MELWGGIECTVNRVGNRFHDQLRIGGGHRRRGDLQRVAALGIRTLRFPILWERCCGLIGEPFDFRWADRRMDEMARLGITPIIGLIHHGSGPRGTSLTGSNFAPRLAEFAGAVARRYRHVVDWTPVNEPLTTARFAALYGHWYPHTRDEPSFWRALVNQIEATALAMAAVRAHVPDARLIQTEDIGRTYAVPALGDVAAHYNARRWASLDLLTGKVDAAHPLWPRIAAAGMADHVAALAPCPPDLIGLNHYVTSDRFLDDRAALHGTLPEVGYHDVAAVRVRREGWDGLYTALTDTHMRYGLPIAVTESQLACTREEQLRWLADGWDAAHRARAEGVDVRALTSWALFGSHGWDALCTTTGGRYEAGAYTTRGPRPRATAIAPLLRRLAQGETAEGIAAQPGWWRRPVRYDPPRPELRERDAPPNGPPILITGATGTLGRAFARACALRGLAYRLTDRTALDICDDRACAEAVARLAPWAVVNAAGWVRVDDAETAAAACLAANRDGAVTLARAARRAGARYATFSSDLVFDGTKDSAYVETDATRPLSVYGRSKAEAEDGVRAACPRALIVRTAAFFSPHDVHNFAVHVEDSLRRAQPVAAAAGYVVTPTYVPDLVDAVLDLLIDGVAGVRHLSSGTALDWHDFARTVAIAADLPVDAIRPADAATLGWRAVRPRNAALASRHGPMLPPLDDALARHISLRRQMAAARTAA